MARYDNREFHREIKSLYKAWSKVDSQIGLPPSLTGDALLPLLDGVPVPRAPEKGAGRKVQFSPRVFSWKSVSTYAAALVLIVALSALISRSPSDIQGGSIVLDEPSAPGGFENPLDPPGGWEPDEPQAGGRVADVDGDEPNALPQPDSQPSDDDPPVPDDDLPPDDESVSPEAEEAPDGGVGGPNESTLLHEDDAYTYTWRPNDLTDPDKAGYPLVVSVIDKNDSERAVSFDVAMIRSVEMSFLYGDKLALLGPSADDDAQVLLVYDLSQPGYAVNVLDLDTVGTVMEARLYKNVINYVLYVPAGVDPGCEITALPDSIGEDLCVIVAVDLDTMQVEQHAFAGANKSVSLYNLNAYLDYEGEVTEENPQGHYVAHVRLNGTDIELRAED